MIVAIIPAKSTSIGIPGKNTKKLGGKTLIERAIESADVPAIDGIYVSTDLDSFEVPSGVDKVGILHRPKELTLDNAQVNDVVSFSIRQLHVASVFPNIIVVLQPTSPFRTSAHVSKALEQYVEYDKFYTCLLSGYWQDKFTYEGNWQAVEPVHHDPMYRRGRQWEHKYSVFVENGAIYIAQTDYILTHNTFRSNKMVPFEMDRTESLELDTQTDWKIAELFLRD
jgi:CMP-N,N'-diacetyllegionaminic acid synthase